MLTDVSLIASQLVLRVPSHFTVFVVGKKIIHKSSAPTVSSSGLLQTVITDVTPVLADDGLRDCISLGLIFPEAVCSVWH